MTNAQNVRQAFAARLSQLADMSAAVKADLKASEVDNNDAAVAPAGHCGSGSQD